MLKTSLLFFATAFLAVVCLPLAGRSGRVGSPWLAFAQTAAPAPAAPAKNPVRPTAESQAKAKTIYARDCALCHGDTGNGKTDLAAGMSLTLDDWTNPATLAGRTDGDLFAVIRNGKDKMPAEEVGRATDTEVWNLVVYIRSFSKGQPAGAPAPAGN